MSIRSYLRGIGIGMLVTAIVLTVSHISSGTGSLDNEEIKKRARSLGMMEANEVLLSEAETLAGQKAAMDSEVKEATSNPAIEAGATKELDGGGSQDKEDATSEERDMLSAGADSPEDDVAAANPFDNADTEGGKEAEDSKEAEDRQATAGGSNENTPAAGAGDESSTGSAKTGSSSAGSAKTDNSSADNVKTESSSAGSSKVDNSSVDSAKTDSTAAAGSSSDSAKADNGKSGKTAQGTESSPADTAATESAKTEPIEDQGASAAGGVSFQIGSGLGSMDVAKQLQSAGYVSDASAFDSFLCANGYDRKIKSGDHFIPKGASETDIAKIITKS